MKILQVSTFYEPTVGGVETQVADLSRELRAAGHEVTIATTDSGRGAVRLPVGSFVDSQGTQFRRFRTQLNLSQFHRLSFGLLSYMWQADYEVIHVHGLRKLELFGAIVIARILRRKRLIVSTHNPFTTTGRGLFSRLVIALQDVFLGWPLYRFCQGFVLLSTSEIPITRRFGVAAGKLHVLANAVNADFFTPVTSAELQQWQTNLPSAWREFWQSGSGLKVLGVARLNRVKGFQHLLLAAQQLPDARFVIIGGDDGYLSELRALFAGQQNVLLTEAFLPRADLRFWYAAADVFVLPSEHEPFGIVLLEAAAQKAAIVAAASDGPRSLLEGTGAGVLVPAADPQALARALAELAGAPELRENYAERAYQLALKYSWSEILPKYLQIYFAVSK